MQESKAIIRLHGMMDSAGIRHFHASELLFRGGGHANGTAHNDLAPEELFPNLVAVAKIADRLREDFGSPLRVLSAYRSPGYNAAIGGAKNSLHLRGMALDLAPVVPGMIDVFRDFCLARWARHGWEGGLGRYRWGCHVDTGRRRSW